MLPRWNQLSFLSIRQLTKICFCKYQLLEWLSIYYYVYLIDPATWQKQRMKLHSEYIFTIYSNNIVRLYMETRFTWCSSPKYFTLFYFAFRWHVEIIVIFCFNWTCRMVHCMLRGSWVLKMIAFSGQIIPFPLEWRHCEHRYFIGLSEQGIYSPSLTNYP